MTALAAAKEAMRKDGVLIATPLKDEAKIWKGALVCYDPTTGTLVPGGDTAAFRFAGVAAESVDNTGGVEAGRSCRIHKTGSFVMTAASADNTWLGQEACIVDDATVALAATTTNDIKAGKIVEVLSATLVRVRIDGYC